MTDSADHMKMFQNSICADKLSYTKINYGLQFPRENYLKIHLPSKYLPV